MPEEDPASKKSTVPPQLIARGITALVMQYEVEEFPDGKVILFRKEDVTGAQEILQKSGPKDRNIDLKALDVLMRGAIDPSFN